MERHIIHLYRKFIRKRVCLTRYNLNISRNPSRVEFLLMDVWVLLHIKPFVNLPMRYFDFDTNVGSKNRKKLYRKAETKD